MSTKTTTALLFLFFAGLILVWRADRSAVEPDADRLLEAELVLPELLDRRPTDIDRVEIQGTDSRIVLARRDGGWQVVEPIDVAADRSAVEGFLRDLGTLRRLGQSEAIEGEPGRYGLEAPTRVVRLLGPGGSETLAVLELGRESAGRRYVRAAGGGPIRVVRGSEVAASDWPLDRWRERRLFDLRPIEVGSIAIRGPGRDLELSRESGRWRLVRPFRAPVDPAKAEELLADLLALRAVEEGGFVADEVSDLSAYGLAAPDVTVRVRTAEPNPTEQVVEIGRLPSEAETEPEGHSYARRADQNDVVRIPNEPIRPLGRSPEPLRTPLVADLDRARVAAIRLVEAEQSHDLVRSPEGWLQAGSKPTAADQSTLESLLKALEGTQASQRLDPAEASRLGLEPPIARLHIWESARPVDSVPETQPSLSLEIGRRDRARKAVYLRYPGDPVILVVPDTLADSVPLGPFAFRERRLLQDDPGAIGSIRIDRPDDRFELERGDTPGKPPTWRLVAPVEAPANREAVERILLALAGLRAERFLTDQPDPALRAALEDQPTEVSWTVRDDRPASGEPAATRPRVLRIGGAVGARSEARVARLSDRPEIFTLPSRLVEVFDAELRDRRVAVFDPGRVVAITLRWPDRALEFQRAGAGGPGVPDWKPAPGSEPTGFDRARLNPMLLALREAMATRFVQHRGPFHRSVGLTPPLFEIQLALQDDPQPLRVRFGSPVVEGTYRGHYLATTEPDDAGAVFLIPAAEWSSTVVPPRRPDDLPASVFAP